MAKLFFYDLETTGLDCSRNGIHQIAGIIEIDGVVKEEFNFKVRPFPNDQIDPGALTIAGVTKEEIFNYPYHMDIYLQLTNIIARYINKFDKTDKFHLVGYNNCAFDNAFFRQFFTKCLDKFFGSYFHSDSIDVMVLASYKLMDERTLIDSFKLSSVAQYLGIKIDETGLHDAMYDIRLTREIFKTIWR